MIEALFLGSMLSYVQFNRYVDNNFKIDSESTNVQNMSNDISRYSYIMVYVNQYLNGLLLLCALIYGVYLIEYVVGVSTMKRSKLTETKMVGDKRNELFVTLLSFFPHYKPYFLNKDTFLQQVMKMYMVGLVMSYLLITAMIVLRKSKRETNIRKIKQDVLIFTILSFLINVLIFLYF